MRILVIIINIAFLLALPFALYFAFYFEVFANMIGHYSPETKKFGEYLQVQILYWSVIGLPILIIVGSAISWLLLSRKKYSKALLISLLPLISILTFFIILSIPLK